jgi:hypothetical protein
MHKVHFYKSIKQLRFNYNGKRYVSVIKARFSRGWMAVQCCSGGCGLDFTVENLSNAALLGYMWEFDMDISIVAGLIASFGGTRFRLSRITFVNVGRLI